VLTAGEILGRPSSQTAQLRRQDVALLLDVRRRAAETLDYTGEVIRLVNIES